MERPGREARRSATPATSTTTLNRPDNPDPVHRWIEAKGSSTNVAHMMRRATVNDVAVLWEMERQASSAGLAHVFPADIPFPDDDVMARWRLVLEEPGMTVVIDEHDGEPAGYVAYGDGWLRHLGVLPVWWGTDRARRLHAEAMAGLAAHGTRTAYLWVLVDNHRARAFYEREGWRDAGLREREVFAPYPTKMQMRRSANG